MKKYKLWQILGFDTEKDYKLHIKTSWNIYQFLEIIKKLENKENKTERQRGWNMCISEILLEWEKLCKEVKNE
jgi:hypothetical protein